MKKRTSTNRDPILALLFQPGTKRLRRKYLKAKYPMTPKARLKQTARRMLAEKIGSGL